jgi:hypothetical protein
MTIISMLKTPTCEGQSAPTLIQVAMNVAQPSIMMQTAMCGRRYHGLSCSRSTLRYQYAVSRPGWRKRAAEELQHIATASLPFALAAPLMNVLFLSILGRIKVSRF